MIQCSVLSAQGEVLSNQCTGCPPFADNPGKQEIIPAYWGEVRFYLEGEASLSKGLLVKGKEGFYTKRREVILWPGDTLVLEPGSKHWFKAEEVGADGFTDPGVVR